MKLVEIRDAVKARRRVYRVIWPHHATWAYDPLADLVFVDRPTHLWFWSTIIQEATLPGIPAGLTVRDLDADDWEIL